MRQRAAWYSLGLLLIVVTAAGAYRLAAEPTAMSMAQAAQALLEAMPPELRAQASLPFEGTARTDWHFIPKDKRKGVQLKEMNGDQRKLAKELLKTGLSEMGFAKANSITMLEVVLNELEKSRVGGPIRDPMRYYFTVFGKPAETGAWGWSAEGHHLSLNFAVRDGRVVSCTPSFFGANPALSHHTIGGGAREGERVLLKEETLAFSLLESFSPEQRAVVLIADKAPPEVSGAGEVELKKQAPAGLAAAKMSPGQKTLLSELIETYIKNVTPALAEPRLNEIKAANTDLVHFAWAGASRPGIGHYYRIQGPTFVIELVNVQPDASGNPANHIHSQWRSLSGDFGLVK